MTKQEDHARLDARMDALVRERLGFEGGLQEYLDLMGVRAFHPKTQSLPTRVRVMDVGELLERIKEKQRSLRTALASVCVLERSLTTLKETLANLENVPPSPQGRIMDEREVDRLHVALSQRYYEVAALRYELWTLTRTRAIDLDAFHKELQELLTLRISAGVRVARDAAIGVALARASQRRRSA